MGMRASVLLVALFVSFAAKADGFRGGDARDLYSLLKPFTTTNGDGKYLIRHVSSVRCTERDDKRVATCTFYDANAFGRGPRLLVTGRDGKRLMLILAKNFPWSVAKAGGSLKVDAIRCYLEGLGQNNSLDHRFYSCVSP